MRAAARVEYVAPPASTFVTTDDQYKSVANSSQPQSAPFCTAYESQSGHTQRPKKVLCMEEALAEYVDQYYVLR
jgi:hypothetical protein